jgi:hypothetical protein
MSRCKLGSDAGEVRSVVAFTGGRADDQGARVRLVLVGQLAQAVEAPLHLVDDGCPAVSAVSAVSAKLGK